MYEKVSEEFELQIKPNNITN